MKIINEGLIDTSFLVTFGATPGPDSVHQSVQFSAFGKPPHKPSSLCDPSRTSCKTPSVLR